MDEIKIQAELNLDRYKFRKNISYLKEKSRNSFFCPMVKANAYGVGDLQVVGELLDMGVDSFGVARLEEGLKLRRYFPEKKMQILVFYPLIQQHVKFYKASLLTPVICSFKQLQVYLDNSLLMPIHLKFDLGMNRFGFELEDAEKILKIIKTNNISVEALCGHFPDGSDFLKDGKSFSRKKLNELTRIKTEYFEFAKFIHAPNSDAILNGDFKVGLRPGLSMYYSSIKKSGIENALSLSAPVVEIRDIKKGEGVSYKSIFKSNKDSKIAILPIGYADGLPRGLSNKISVNFGNKSFPLVGAICMDYCMVDIGLNSGLEVGDTVDFLGENMKNLASWAKILDTIPYEIITGFGPRIKRGVI